MRTCSRCHTPSPDATPTCPRCQADLSRESETAVALERLLANPRLSHVRLMVHEDACPACKKVEGTYPKELAPVHPIRGCSHPQGCRCFYEPALLEIYP